MTLEHQPYFPDIAIVSDEVADRFDDAVAVCLPMGVRTFEIRRLSGGRVPDVDPAEIEALARAVANRGVRICGVSPGIGKGEVDSSASRREIAERLPATIRVMERIGVTRMSVFSYRRTADGPAPQRVVDALGAVKTELEREGFELIIENVAGCYGDTGERLAALCDALGVGATWDPANAEASGETAYPEGYERVRQHIVHVHLKNWAPGRGNVDLVDGRVDMSAQLRGLVADGYTGLLCAEPHQWDERPGSAIRNLEQLIAMRIQARNES